MSLPPGFFEDHLEVTQGSERVGRILVVVIDLFSEQQETGCLDIQLGKRLKWLHRIDGFCFTTRIATWSLGMDRTPKLSET